MTALVLVELEDGAVKPASRSAITAARRFGDVHAMYVGLQDATQISRIAGVNRVLHVQDGTPLAETISDLMAGRAATYTHILGAASALTKNILPRLAGLLDVQPVTEVIDILDEDTFIRPIYAGNALATVRSRDACKILTVRAANFEPADDSESTAEVETVAPIGNPKGAEHLGLDLTQSDRPELESARVVISGGRGLKDAANFKLLEGIATKLNAAIGASRAAVDAGFAPNEMQVGQTGKIVAPDLYIAVGLSGAIQHLAGMKDSRIIVAINMDAEAPIFKVADYGIVGDLFEILPTLENAL